MNPSAQIRRALGSLAFIAFLICCLGGESQAHRRTGIPSIPQRTGLAEVNGTKLYYEIAGRGPTVVLIHGGLVDRRMWDDQFWVLAREYRVIRYDLRGFGKSATPTENFAPVDDLTELLKFLKIDRATVIGLSFGGQVATDYALQHPEVVERLVLVSSSLRGYQGPPNQSARAVYQAAETVGMNQAIEMWLDNELFATGKNNPRFVRRMRTMLADNYKYWGPTPTHLGLIWPKTPTIDRLGEIKAPTLIITGEKDTQTIRDIGDILAEKIPGARRVVMPGVSHHLNMEHPRSFNRLLVNFLRSAKSPRSIPPATSKA
jgi:pimeloyl-ACP methyl ester carboxylesterase